MVAVRALLRQYTRNNNSELVLATGIIASILVHSALGFAASALGSAHARRAKPSVTVDLNFFAPTPVVMSAAAGLEPAGLASMPGIEEPMPTPSARERRHRTARKTQQERKAEVAARPVTPPGVTLTAAPRSTPSHLAGWACALGGCWEATPKVDPVGSRSEAGGVARGDLPGAGAGGITSSEPTGTGNGSGTASTAVGTGDWFDSEATPLVRARAHYPQRALDRGLEGWVLVRFVISKDGEVLRPEVVDASPTHVFDESALDSIRRWKYRPQLRGGRVQERRAAVKVVFKLDD